MHQQLKNFLPVLSWLPSYDRSQLGPDLLAGLTTGVMLVPQAMAYAMLAGLPPEVGLYASMLPLVVYAIFGTSRQLAVGPVAMVSLLVASAIAQMGGVDAAATLGIALLIALMVGVIQLAMGLLRMGFLVSFLSHPVLSGFTSAAALIIGMSQLKHLLGIDLARSHYVHEVVAAAVEGAGDTHLITLAIGMTAIAALLLLKRFTPRAPRALIVVALGVLVVWGFGLHEGGVAIVGDIPAGLPPLTLPPMSPELLVDLLPAALTIALIAFMESVAVAKVFARRHRYPVDPNQELIGLGFANVAAAFTGGYAVTGGFSRSAVNDQAGARTPLAAVFTAGLVALTAVALTPLFFYLPKAILAAIIMTAVIGLVDVKEVRHLWHVKPSELVLLGLTFFATLGLGIEAGIGIGVGASVLWLLVRMTKPHTAVMGRLPGTTVYRNLRHYPEAELTPGVAILRIDERFYFGNVAHIERTIREACDTNAVRVVVLDASPVNDIDASGEAALDDLRMELEARDIRLQLANVKGPVRDVLARSGLTERLGAQRFHNSVHYAVLAAAAEIGDNPGGPHLAAVPQTSKLQSEHQEAS